MHSTGNMRRYLFYVGIGILGLGVIVGVVLYLRSVNAPTGSGQSVLNTSSAPSSGTPKGSSSDQTGATAGRTKLLRPIVPIEQQPKSPPYKSGDPFPASTVEPTSPK